MLSKHNVAQFSHMLLKLVGRGPTRGLIMITTQIRMKMIMGDCIEFLEKEGVPHSFRIHDRVIRVGDTEIKFESLDNHPEPRIMGMVLDDLRIDSELHSWHNLNATHHRSIDFARSRVR